MDNRQKFITKMNSTSIEFSISQLGNGLGNIEEGEEWCWCCVNLMIKSHLFDYKKMNYEMLTFGEVKDLYQDICDLLDDKLKEPNTKSFTEIDIEFGLYPKYDVREDNAVLYVREGCEIADISAELVLNLQDINNVYSGERYIYPMEREEIIKLKDYLETIIPILQKQWDKSIIG